VRLGIGVTVDRPFHGAGNDLGVAVAAIGVSDDRRDEQRMSSFGRAWFVSGQPRGSGKLPCAQTVSIYNRKERKLTPFAMSVKKLLDLTGKTASSPALARPRAADREALGEMGAKLAISARKPDELEQAREFLASSISKPFRWSATFPPEAIEPMVSKLLERTESRCPRQQRGATWGAPAEDILSKPGRSS